MRLAGSLTGSQSPPRRRSRRRATCKDPIVSAWSAARLKQLEPAQGGDGLRKLLIANRGEIAIRIARTAAEMGLATVAVFSQDDAAALHVKKADEALPLKGEGPAPYLDIPQLIEAAGRVGC